MEPTLDRSIVPTPTVRTAPRVGAHKSFQRADGLRVIVVEDQRVPWVSVQLKFDAAPVRQGELAGVHDLFSELLGAGTQLRDKASLDLAVDSMGLQFGATGDGVYGAGLLRYFPELLDLVWEVATRPAFPEDEFSKSVTRFASALKARNDDPDQVAEVAVRNLAFGDGHPYGEVVTDATVARVHLDDVKAYHRYLFKPEQGYLVVVGAVDAEQVRQAIAARELTILPVADVAALEPGSLALPAESPRSTHVVDMPGTEQSVLRLMAPVDLRPNDPMALAAQVMNTLLGGGVFNARLMQDLREDKGYTYGVYSTVEIDPYGGTFGIGCSVRNAVVGDALARIMAQVERIRDTPVDPEELSLTKNYMAGGFGRSLEDPRTVARFALNVSMHGLPHDHYDRYLKRLDAITVADVQAAAQRFLQPDELRIVVAGDRAAVIDQLEVTPICGTVRNYALASWAAE